MGGALNNGKIYHLWNNTLTCSIYFRIFSNCGYPLFRNSGFHFWKGGDDAKDDKSYRLTLE